MTYNLESYTNDQDKKINITEILSADIQVITSNENGPIPTQTMNSALDTQLSQVNRELEKYTSQASKADYAYAIASGLLTGIMDAMFVGQMSITKDDIGVSHKQINHFIENFAEKHGMKGKHLKNKIAKLEEAFPVLQDNVWKGKGISVSAQNHHLADLAHHPTPLGLLSAIVVQFFRVGTFVNKEGETYFLLVKTTAKDIVEILEPAIITGLLNWLVAVGEKEYQEETQENLPEYIHKLAHIVASTPMIIEIVQCANNWFGHLVSDMGGSKQTAGGGMGIPGLFISLLQEISGLPLIKDTNLPKIVNDLYQNKKIDLRHELPLYKNLGKQAIPVAFNEILVRLCYFITHLAAELRSHGGIKGLDWDKVLPFGNRTIDRMMTVSTMTFTIADTTDAAVRAAIESGGNWTVFAGKFVTRFNYIGAGRATLAIVKEISDEKKETQLIHERRMLTEEKADIVMKQLQEYKAALEEKVSGYLAEDIAAFMTGLDYMDQGFVTGDSDLVIKGNVVIQRVLGREPQFTNQKEFDDLMESDEVFQL